jgi:hypothetical protein
MSYTFSFEKRDHLTVVSLKGEKNFLAAMEIWIQLQRIIEDEHLDKVMILDNMQARLSPAQVLLVEQQLEKRNFPWQTKIAIVDLELREWNNDNAFGETVAINRERTNIRVFEKEEQALNWLNGK